LREGHGLTDWGSNQQRREIKRYQTRHGDDTRLMIPKAAFGRLVREVTQDLNLAGFTHVQQGHIRYKPTAVSALQHAAEGYLTEILAESQDLAIHSQREGIDKRDILFANWKATTTPQSRSLANCNVPWKRPRKSKTPRRRKPRRVPVVEAPAAARKVPKKKKTKAAPAEPESEPDDDDEGSNTPAEDADDDAASYADEEQVEEEA
jgi:histone H3/H4